MTMLPMQGPLADPDTMPQIGALANNMPTLKGGGMFGGRGKDAILAAVAGFMSRRNPQMSQMLLQPMLMRQQQMQADAQRRQKMQDDIDVARAKRQIDVENPLPAQPTEYERMLGAAGFQPGTPEYLQHVRNYVTMRENPMVMTPYGPMPYSSVSGAQNMPQIGAVMDDPRRQGGAGGNVSGNFPY
jgi:hypothetical protein